MSTKSTHTKTLSKPSLTRSGTQVGRSTRGGSTRSKTNRKTKSRGARRTPTASVQQHGFVSKFLGSVDVKSEGKSLRALTDRKAPSLEQLSMLQGVGATMDDPNTVYEFKLGGYTTLGRSAGVSNAFISSDPSASGWNSPEWSSFSAIFAAFRLKELLIDIVPAQAPLVTTRVAPLAICSNISTATNPGSYAAIADNPDRQWLQWYSTTNGGCRHVMKAYDLQWSEVATPTITPYAGAPGCIQLYADNTAASGTDTILYNIYISGIYQFRTRV